MPIDLVVGLGLVKTALDLVKGVRDALRNNKLKPEEMKDYLDTLQDKLVDVKTALADADDERRGLLSRIAELERCADIGKEFKAEDEVYWFRGDSYCPVCWDVDRKPVRLAGPERNSMSGGRETWKCPLHNADYRIGYAVSRQMKANVQSTC